MTIQQDIQNYTPFNEQESCDKQIILDFIAHHSDAFLRSNPIAHVTASSWIVNHRHDKVLMVYHNIYHSWSWTGGHADGNQNLLEVAIRECREETGIQNVRPISENICSLEVLSVDGHEKNGKYVSTHLHLNVTYLLEADENDPLIIRETENSGVRWFSLQEALDASTEPWFVRRIYKKLNEKLSRFPVNPSTGSSHSRTTGKNHSDPANGQYLRPFVKWAGGKSQLLPRLIERMPANYHRYFEPFIGGGALFLAQKPKNAVINDINPQLINIYTQLKNDPKAVISVIQNLDASPCNKEHYLQIREQYNVKIAEQSFDAETAGLMIWINKHCFNGLYRVNAKGMFNVPYNNHTGATPMNTDNLLRIGEYLQTADVTFLHEDFETACENVQPGDFVYFDSPYIPLTQTANFTDYDKSGFTSHDHQRLAHLFRKLDQKGAMIMLSNHDVPQIYDLYSGYNIETFDVRRMINCDASKRTGSEVIIRNYSSPSVSPL